MSAKILAVILIVLILASNHHTDAQQPQKIPRVGFLSGSGDLSTPGLQIEAFRRGLRS